MQVQVFLERFVDILFTVLYFAVIARVLMSWLPIPPGNRVAQFLIEITDPVLAPLRRVIPPIGMFDISPIIALVLLTVLKNILLNSLGGY